ncbi:hypothetical protein XA68_13185 [Ophiocordyceps unilateralis]|uniref:Uncharacterized protein n=1 Tax=Ophiocordyceps unilateralis TaxID=268505 RepID=A0A2A9PD23_OPHUN|nr:hypothetical protein XA68_13185 [Ophiocordyceps unilateralis]
MQMAARGKGGKSLLSQHGMQRRCGPFASQASVKNDVLGLPHTFYSHDRTGSVNGIINGDSSGGPSKLQDFENEIFVVHVCLDDPDRNP